ncbi:hypothetical protein HK100_009935 [Physocladia obscura]|uniref:glutathione gamma-glutamylcysteinyltransferase n=1 Tax=Physocladia obscura TaxID=109957 RepID=A0AAD5T3H0_9FUNG|nr:hypothetical protein HK100_009935 [Physocladia obscura]
MHRCRHMRRLMTPTAASTTRAAIANPQLLIQSPTATTHKLWRRASSSNLSVPILISSKPSPEQHPPLSCAATHLHSLPPPPSTFYRRSLPHSLTSLNSKEGKRLFKESLARGTAESFMHLSGNLAHQSEPAFCGLGSLAIVLNALEIDPNRPWKGVWRWYDETLLDCCPPLETVKLNGITFDEFASLAACNGLSVTPKRPSTTAKTTNVKITKDEFIQDLKRVCSDPDGTHQIVVSFSRPVLGQTGDGHFSPVACFHEESGMVLVLDVARFKYPSYFVHVDKLYEAMKPVDIVTGQTRGYFVLSKKKESQSLNHVQEEAMMVRNGYCDPGCAVVHEVGEPLLGLVKITPLSLLAGGAEGRGLTQKLVQLVNGLPNTASFATVVSKILTATQKHLSLSFAQPAIDLTTHNHHRNNANDSRQINNAHDKTVDALVAQIEAMPIYQTVVNACDEMRLGVNNAVVHDQRRHQIALAAILVVSLPGSIYLAVQRPELRSFFMEAKYALADGPKTRVKSEVARMENQLNNLIV